MEVELEEVRRLHERLPLRLLLALAKNREQHKASGVHVVDIAIMSHGEKAEIVKADLQGRLV